MKKLIVLLLLLPVFGWAQSSLDGTWKIDLNSVKFPTKPDVFVLQNGSYTCKTCVPPFTVKADGTDQKVSGHPGMDMFAIKAIDDKHVEQSWKKGGKPMGSEKDTLSADGKTMTADFVDTSAPNGKTVTGHVVLTRVAAGPSGSHPFSGSWRAEKASGVTDDALMFTYKMDGDSLSYSTPTGQSYTAKLGGGDALFTGDPNVTMVSVQKLGPNTFEETDKRDGKVVSVSKMTVSGKTMKIDNEDKLHGTTSHFVANKM